MDLRERVTDLLPGIRKDLEDLVRIPSVSASPDHQDDVRRSVSGLPWLQNLPVLGALFSSKDFLDRQTELMVIVTAYLVKPTSPNALARPDQNLLTSSSAPHTSSMRHQTSGSAASVISLPRMAVNPHSTTQK